MQTTKVFFLLSLLAVSFCFNACKETEPPVIPVSELILGTWLQTELYEEGSFVNLAEYKTFEFTAENVIRKEFDIDNTLLLEQEEIYSIGGNSDLIDFEFSTDYDIESINETELIITYSGFNLIGQTVEKREIYEKQ